MRTSVGVLATSLLLAGTMLGGGAQAADEAPRTAVPTVQVASKVSAFTSQLRASGFEVTPGSAVRIDAAEMVDGQAIDSAAGNNAGQPYKVFAVPDRVTNSDDDDVRTSRAFRIAADEAIVYVGRTPPKGDYFSFTPFLFSRRQGRIQPKGDWMFAALGNPLNNATIKHSGKSAFNATTMIIFAADQGVAVRVKKAAKRAGYLSSLINTYLLPGKLLHLGRTPDSDTLLILARTANLVSPAGEQYLANDSYAAVLRVTPQATPKADPAPTITMAKRKWRKETDLYPGLPAALKRLERAILAQTPHASAQLLSSGRWWPESRKVLEAEPGSPDYHKFVAGEAADTPYRRTANFQLAQSDTIVVYGVNHAATGLATYSNFSVYSERVLNRCGSLLWPTRFGCGNPVWSGVAGMASKDFTGSAAKYLPGDKLAKYLYAVTVSRDPASGAMVTIPQPAAETLPATGIRPNDPVLVGFRAYLNPHTGRGPAYSDVMADRAMVLRAG